MTARRQTPSQTVGPFFGVGPTREPWNVLAPDGASGTRVRVEGTVYDGAGDPVGDAMIEIWQADAAGRYHHPLDLGAEAAGSLTAARPFTGFGRTETTPEGAYFFETIKPGPVRAADGRWQAPHLNVIVFARGMLVHAFTRMYFGDEPATAGDPLLARLDPARARTLIGERRDRDGRAVYVWDIHLQGARETVFLDA